MVGAVMKTEGQKSATQPCPGSAALPNFPTVPLQHPLPRRGHFPEIAAAITKRKCPLPSVALLQESHLPPKTLLLQSVTSFLAQHPRSEICPLLRNHLQSPWSRRRLRPDWKFRRPLSKWNRHNQNQK